MDPFIESLIKIFASILLGAAIGLERELHGKPAGLRTHILVCLGSTLLIVVAESGALASLSFPAGTRFSIDPERMAAGIITGIGFLGAGAIMRVEENLVRGLTTAACIWFAAAIGIAVGNGVYLLSVISTAAALALLTLLERLEHVFDIVTYRTLSLKVEKEKVGDLESSCSRILEAHRVSVLHVDYRISNAAREAELTLHLRFSAKPNVREIMIAAADLPGVSDARWA